MVEKPHKSPPKSLDCAASLKKVNLKKKNSKLQLSKECWWSWVILFVLYVFLGYVPGIPSAGWKVYKYAMTGVRAPTPIF